jgi:hypothetical protein
MILNDFVITGRASQCFDQAGGLDSREQCHDRVHWDNYPWSVSYNYNSRGFRDAEWPENLKDAVWCIGDSQTVGFAGPLEHSWPWLLQQQLGRRCINVAMDGGSNNWIARRTVDILREVAPGHIVIHWSYCHRRESSIDLARDQAWKLFYKNVRLQTWPECDCYADFDSLPPSVQLEVLQLHGWERYCNQLDEYRKIYNIRCTVAEDDENFRQCVNLVQSHAGNTRIIHSVIPGFAPSDSTASAVLAQCQFAVPELPQLDWARDSSHYDIKTAQSLVNSLLPLIAE